MVLWYDKDGALIGKDYECSWSFSQKRNKEGTGKLELLTYPHGAKYVELYKGDEKIQTAVIVDHTRDGAKVNTSIRTLETLFKNYRLPDNWNGWHKKPLSFILADAVYGFDYIRKSNLTDFTDYIEKVNIDLNKIKDGDIHLALHKVGESIQYHEMGYITFAFDCGEAVSQRYVRWMETTGEKVYIGIQSVSSDTPIVSATDVDFSNAPVLTINRSIEHDSEISGVPIASDKRYVAVRFILKYINADWIQDFATHKVYNENNVLVDRTVRGFTPVIRAFEIITRKKTAFTVRSSPVDMGELVEGVEFKSGGTIWDALQKIRERYPFDTMCSFEDGKLFFDFARSLVKDKKMQAAYILRANDASHNELNNTSIKALKQDVLKVNVLHCYGEGEKQQQLYVRLPETGTYDGGAAVEEVFTDTSIKTKDELQKKGLKQLLEKRKEAAPVFEVETLIPIRLFDAVSLVHPETNDIYETVVEEEHISYKGSALTQKFGLGGFLFNPIDALIKKDKQPAIREYALQPFGLTAYGKSKSIILVWKGEEASYSIKWKKKTDTEYNIRHVQGFTTEFEAVEPNAPYLFSIAGVNGRAVSDYTAEIEAHTVPDNTLFTWIKFAYDASGNGISDHPSDNRHWMGIAHNKLTAEESDNPAEYTWINLEGKQGIAGEPGKDGKPRFTWVKYANDAKGTGMSDKPDGKDYIGFAFNKETEQESDNPADYYWQKVKGEQGIPGIPGKDGSTKLLPSLETTGDYENQIGTFQGRLYRWTGGKWELLNAVMPLNPVAHYDMADVQSQDSIFFELSKPIIEKRTPEIIGGRALPVRHKKGTYYRIHSDVSYSGNAMPVVIVYRADWEEGTIILWAPLIGVQDFTVFVPQHPLGFGIGVWMHGWGGYEVQPDDSVTVHKFMVTEIKEKILIDSSGNGNHSTAVGGVEKAKDGKIGTALDFNKGCVTHQLHTTIFQHGYLESTGKYDAKILCNLSAYKGKTIKITVSGYRKGEGGFPELYIYSSGWEFGWSSGGKLDGTTEKTMTDTITLPTAYNTIWCTLYHIPGNKMNNTIVMTHCTIELVENKSISCIGVGKQWTHSRWIKMNGDAQDKTVNPRLWYYGMIDYCYTDIAANKEIMNNINIVTYKTNSEAIGISILKEKIADDKWHNLIVCNDVQSTYARKIVYLDGKLIKDTTVNGDFTGLVNNVNYDMSAGNDYVKGSLATLLFFDRLLTEQEALYLCLNPQYPVKNYTLTDWAIDPANPDSNIKNLTPKYLGVTETVPTTRTVVITKGERLGAQDANPGDWVLMAKTVGGWKVGVCYRWTGSMWINLEPEYNYTEQYQAALYHICEIEELMKNTGHFGALFAKVLVAQKALIDELVAEEAFITKLSGDIAFLKELTTQKVFVENLIANNSFIKKLATQDAFLENLVAKKFKIDSDEQNPNDFEVAINNEIGISAKNNGHEIFRIKKSGEAFLNDAELKNVTVTGKITPNKGLLNTWYWGKMVNTNQYEWFNVFKDRIDIGERLNIFGGGCFYNDMKGGWQHAIVVFIERLSEDKFELNGYPINNQWGYLTRATFQKNSNKAFASSFYIGW
ncbi:LamG domain-containing protein [Treponema sp. OMZ 857]|uniref:LamG domain-containing protein n=1 Tax=Treponema sp. OMZ 857 TaxID=1643513 RepID=UPI0020A36F40|nr:LamG domain-containing protein [Treponema sp. OMZ 857]